MLVILDRDGVINEDSPHFIKSPAEWHAIPGSLEAIARLKKTGHQVVIATNQSGIARAYFSWETLTAIHNKMRASLQDLGADIDGIYICPHVDADNCECRKPKPGLFWQIASRYPESFSHAIAIGDSLRDIQAAQAANCRAVLVKTGKGQEHGVKVNNLFPTVPVFENLAEAVQQLF